MSKGYIRFSYAELARVLQLPEGCSIFSIEHQPLQQTLFVLVEHPAIPAVSEDAHLPLVRAWYQWRYDLDGKEWKRLEGIDYGT
jgi:hypothetical protein